MPIIDPKLASAALGSVDDLTLLAARNSGYLNPRRPKRSGKSSKPADSEFDFDMRREKRIRADDLADGLDKVMGPLNFAAFLGPAAIGGIGGAMGWLGRTTRLNALQTAGQKLSGVPSLTLGEAFGGIPVVSHVGRGIAKTTAAVAGVGADAMGKLGINSAMSARYAAAAEKHAADFTRAYGVLDNYSLHGEARAALNDVKIALGKMDSEAFDGAIGKLQSAVQQHHPELDEKWFSPRRFFRGVSDFILPTSAELHSPKTAVGKLKASGIKFWRAQYQAGGWANLGDAARASADRMGKAPIGHGLMNATFIAGAAVSDYHTVRDLSKGLRRLRDMHAAISGQKPEDVSTMSLLFSKVSEPVAMARSELIKEFGPAAILDIANTALNIHATTHSRMFTPLTMIGFVAVPMLNQMVVRGAMAGHLLPTYMDMKQAEEAGQPRPPEAYAMLVGEACKQLTSRGAGESNFAKGLGEVYAQMQMRADDVLKEVASGAMMARMKELQKQAEEIKKHLTAQGIDHQEFAQQNISHVERLRKEGASLPRDVVGAHTQKLAATPAATQLGGPNG